MADTLMNEHISVLYDEALDGLHIKEGGLYIDGTLGAGGHTRGILERGGRVLAFDWDGEAIAFAGERLAEFGERVQFAHASYAEMAAIAPTRGFGAVDGVLLDLGLSSRQLDDPERGFSFRFEGALDMRFDRERGGLTAADVLNGWSEGALADIFWRYGDEKYSRPLARLVVANRPWQTTTALAAAIAAQVPASKRVGRIHPATRVFQALRIAVNDELTAVADGLQAAVNLLKTGGRLAVISFHSLEDRLVKNVMRDLSQEPSHLVHLPRSGWQATLKRVTRKPIGPSEAEVAENPRSRSAKLRVAEKL